MIRKSVHVRLVNFINGCLKVDLVQFCLVPRTHNKIWSIERDRTFDY